MMAPPRNSFFKSIALLALLPAILMAVAAWHYAAKRGEMAWTPAKALKAVMSACQRATGPENKAPGPFIAKGNLTRKSGVQGENTLSGGGLDIEGDKNFKNRVTQSLELIWRADRETFLFIKKYLSVIRNENKTEFYLDGNRAVAAVSRSKANRSATWCAGIIAHQAFHGYLKHKSRTRKKTRPPLPGEKRREDFKVNPAALDYTSLNSILAMEAGACAFQLKVLRKTGAPQSEINILLKRTPRDFSVAHDGNYSIKP